MNHGIFASHGAPLLHVSFIHTHARLPARYSIQFLESQLNTNQSINTKDTAMRFLSEFHRVAAAALRYSRSIPTLFGTISSRVPTPALNDHRRIINCVAPSQCIYRCRCRSRYKKSLCFEQAKKWQFPRFPRVLLNNLLMLLQLGNVQQLTTLNLSRFHTPIVYKSHFRTSVLC